MPAIMRSTSKRKAMLAAALVVALILAGVTIVVASGAQERGEEGMDVTMQPGATTLPAATTTSTDGSGTRGASGPPTTVPARSSAGDPDQPVSSDDPPPSPRPAQPAAQEGIDSFDECAAAGYPIAESYPEQCFTPDGRSFTRPIS
jgi:hypothetical protein